MTNALEAEFSKESAGTCNFLRMINNFITLLLTVTSIEKGNISKEAKVISSLIDERLNTIIEIGKWV